MGLLKWIKDKFAAPVIPEPPAVRHVYHATPTRRARKRPGSYRTPEQILIRMANRYNRGIAYSAKVG